MNQQDRTASYIFFRNIFRIVFHGIPLIGLGLGRLYLSLALILVVTIPYIKAKKINQQIELETDESEKLQLEKLRGFWLYLTWLS